MTEDPSLFVCPKDKVKPVQAEEKAAFRTSYVIVDKAVDLLAKKVEASLVAIVFEKSRFHNGRRHVLFYDGTVQLMNDREFNELKKNGFVKVTDQSGVAGRGKGSDGFREGTNP